MMLHEMAHLVKSDNDKWLIPDDGDDVGQSIWNTRAVEKQCRDAILTASRRKPSTFVVLKSSNIDAKPGGSL